MKTITKYLSLFLLLFALTTTFVQCSNDSSTTESTTDDTTDDDSTDDTFALDCSTEDAAQSTNGEIETMRLAMVDFRNSLSTSLLEEGSVCLDDERFYLWHNTPANNGNRDGITYGDLSDEQLTAFKNKD